MKNVFIKYKQHDRREKIVNIKVNKLSRIRCINVIY